MNTETDQTTGPRRANSPRARLALLLFVISPLAVLTLLCVLIAQSMKHGQTMSATPVGAGAGHTGMSNEYMGIGKQKDPPAKP